jgi:hypothetical protein
MARKTSTSENSTLEHFLEEHVKATHAKGLQGKSAVRLSISFRCTNESCPGVYLESVTLKSRTSTKG